FDVVHVVDLLQHIHVQLDLVDELHVLFDEQQHLFVDPDVHEQHLDLLLHFLLHEHVVVDVYLLEHYLLVEHLDVLHHLLLDEHDDVVVDVHLLEHHLLVEHLDVLHDLDHVEETDHDDHVDVLKQLHQLVDLHVQLFHEHLAHHVVEHELLVEYVEHQLDLVDHDHVLEHVDHVDPAHDDHHVDLLHELDVDERSDGPAVRKLRRGASPPARGPRAARRSATQHVDDDPVPRQLLVDRQVQPAPRRPGSRPRGERRQRDLPAYPQRPVAASPPALRLPRESGIGQDRDSPPRVRTRSQRRGGLPPARPSAPSRGTDRPHDSTARRHVLAGRGPVSPTGGGR